MDRKKYLKNYSREWIKKRRNDFFKNKSCAKCGSNENLELDHIDPKNKVTHKVWSRNKNFREKELLKCQVLCKKCHKEKTKNDLHKMNIGKPNIKLRKITDDQIKEVLYLYKDGMSYRSACKLVGISYSTFSSIKSNKYRKEIFSGVS